MIDIADLEQLASAARECFERYAAGTDDIIFDRFPRGTCGPACELLTRYLREVCGLNALYVEAEAREGDYSHAWVLAGDVIVDVTADQFGQPPVIVSQQSPWHTSTWLPHVPRLPCTTREQWPMYPSLAWERLLRALGGRDLKGEIIAEGKKDAVLGYRVPQWLKDELQRLADADDRKLGPYVQRVLERHVAAEKERGGKVKGK